MRNSRITLREAIKFHGHLGSYLVLGILAGEAALKKLKAKRYFGLEVIVRGANKKPKSCLIDGLQLSTGATYGKGNISKAASAKIKVLVRNPKNRRTVQISLRQHLIEKLDTLKGHCDSEALAEVLYKTDPDKIFIYRH